MLGNKITLTLCCYSCTDVTLLQVFEGGTSDKDGLLTQIHLFRRASIVIGTLEGCDVMASLIVPMRM